MTIETIDGKRRIRTPGPLGWDYEYYLDEIEGETYIILHQNCGDTSRIPLSLISVLIEDAEKRELPL